MRDMRDELSRPSLSDTLTERVLELIRDNQLEPGDRLPSARALASRFGVATPTVRETLRRLQATGAVDIRHGSGVYVNAALHRVLMANPNVSGLHGEQLLQLLDARLLVEPYLAELAAKQRTERSIAQLRDTLATAEQQLTGSDALLHKANMDFHRAVAVASGHRVLHEVVDSLLTVHAMEQMEILRIFDDRARDYDEHRAVLAAIAEGRAADARTLMRVHLEDVHEVVQRRLGLSAVPPQPETEIDER